MINNITPLFLVSEKLNKENLSQQNINDSPSFHDHRESTVEFEDELKKQKTAAEQRAKLMNQIWGDNFLSDSLH